MHSVSRLVRQNGLAPARRPGVLCRPEVEFLTDGIVFVRWPSHASIEEPDALATISLIEELSGNEPRPMLVDMHGMRSVSSAALTKFAQCLPTTKMALVGTSPVEQTIVQFFRTIHRPTYPATYFTADAEALQWLAGERYASAPAVVGETRQKVDPAPGAVADTSIPTRRFRMSRAFAGLVRPTTDAQAEPPSSPIQAPTADKLALERPSQLSAETLHLIAKAFRGKTHSKAFSMALVVAESLDADGITAFADFNTPMRGRRALLDLEPPLPALPPFSGQAGSVDQYSAGHLLPRTVAGR